MKVKKSKLHHIEQILLHTDGSITQILDVLFGEIHIKLLKQSSTPPPQKIRHIFQANTPLNKRQVMIYSRHLPLMYAQSFCDMSLLPDEAKDMIEEGEMPIGRVLNRLKLETRREILSTKCKKMSKKYKAHFGCGGEILIRKYVIYHAQKPLFYIKEVFVRGKLA